MIERVEEYFKSVIIELNDVKNELDKNSNNLNSLKQSSLRLCNLLHNPCSPLAISYDYLIANRSTKIDINSKEKLYRIQLIIQQFGKDLNFDLEHKKVNPSYGLLIQAIRINAFKTEVYWSTDDYIDFKDEILKSRSVKYLNEISSELLTGTKFFIQNNIIDTILHITFTSKKDTDKEFSKYQLEYFKQWVDNTITYRDLSRNSFYDLNEYLSTEKLSFEIKEQIDTKKIELFYEGIDIKLNSLKNDLSEINKEKRIQTINTHKKLINSFLDGNVDRLLIERLNIFIQIDNPEKVIIEYDKILQSDFYSFNDAMVYEPKKMRRFSDVFTANLLFEYLKLINSPKLIPDAYDYLDEDEIEIVKRVSFKFIGDEEKLSNALKSLQLSIDLLKDDSQINYLFEILTSVDLAEFKEELLINCETKQFAYVLKSLSHHFNNLKMKCIEESKLFKSKNNKLITANSLYSKGQLSPKKSEDIDRIINYMK